MKWVKKSLKIFIILRYSKFKEALNFCFFVNILVNNRLKHFLLGSLNAKFCYLLCYSMEILFHKISIFRIIMQWQKIIKIKYIKFFIQTFGIKMIRRDYCFKITFLNLNLSNLPNFKGRRNWVIHYSCNLFHLEGHRCHNAGSTSWRLECFKNGKKKGKTKLC